MTDYVFFRLIIYKHINMTVTLSGMHLWRRKLFSHIKLDFRLNIRTGALSVDLRVHYSVADLVYRYTMHAVTSALLFLISPCFILQAYVVTFKISNVYISIGLLIMCMGYIKWTYSKCIYWLTHNTRNIN